MKVMTQKRRDDHSSAATKIGLNASADSSTTAHKSGLGSPSTSATLLGPYPPVAAPSFIFFATWADARNVSDAAMNRACAKAANDVRHVSVLFRR